MGGWRVSNQIKNILACPFEGCLEGVWCCTRVSPEMHTCWETSFHCCLRAAGGWVGGEFRRNHLVFLVVPFVLRPRGCFSRAQTREGVLGCSSGEPCFLWIGIILSCAEAYAAPERHFFVRKRAKGIGRRAAPPRKRAAVTHPPRKPGRRDPPSFWRTRLPTWYGTVRYGMAAD